MPARTNESTPQPPFRVLLGDSIRKERFRPFDSELKELLKSPGVFPRLWDSVRTSPTLELGPNQPYPDAIDKDVGMTWLGEEYRESQVTFRTDLVADIGNRRIVHIEQQTKHRRLPMLRRLATYSSLISSYYQFQANLFQMYYYTGDKQIRWQKGYTRQLLVQNTNWSFANRFIFVDAGSQDAWAMLNSGHPEYAMLGLLSRDIPREEDFVAELLKLIEKRYGRDNIEVEDKLVTCLMVASLRRREGTVMEKMSRDNRNRIARSEKKLYARFKPLLDEVVEYRAEAMAEAMAEARAEARLGSFEAMLRRGIALQERARMDIPVDFAFWCSHHIQADQMDRLEASIDHYDDLTELLVDRGIPLEALGPQPQI